jgi:hypothetical protein
MIFQHHPDGYIIVGDVLLPVDEFLVYEPDYSGLPQGSIGRIYEPGVRHALTDGQKVTGGPLSWLEGDVYISKVEIYRIRHPNFTAMEQAIATFDIVQATQAALLATASPSPVDIRSS